MLLGAKTGSTFALFCSNKRSADNERHPRTHIAVHYLITSFQLRQKKAIKEVQGEDRGAIKASAFNGWPSL